jgi:hypothetical protein
MPEKINLKEQRVILAHGFSPWLTGSIVFKPVVRQNIIAGSMWWSKAA